ncbi:MAG TPA: hypothetical protein VHO46_07870 [Bacteroidales bacterium]|nr:hypothetical protein [Bacteroidales bacterium]
MSRIVYVLLSVFFIGCSNMTVEKKRKQVMKIAEKYIEGQMKSPKKTISKEGLVLLEDSVKSYIIDPSAVFTGRVNDDNHDDAIITIVSYKSGYLGLIEHLVLINTNGHLIMQCSVESDMKILGLENGLITAEVPEYSRNSPLFNCPSCREVVKFRFVDGKLIRQD